jgi:tyrosine-protein phosphatase OCA6
METVPLVPPLCYAVVNPGITRGGYPTLRNYRFLSRLHLRTIISLVPEEPITDLQQFAEMAGATIIHISINRVSSINESMQSSMVKALNVKAVV